MGAGEHDWSAVPPSTAVVDAIAAIEDVDPVDLPTECGVVLHEHVDTDALDTLVRGAEEVRLSFTVEEYRVRIDGSRLVVERD